MKKKPIKNEMVLGLLRCGSLFSGQPHLRQSMDITADTGGQEPGDGLEISPSKHPNAEKPSSFVTCSAIQSPDTAVVSEKNSDHFIN